MLDISLGMVVFMIVLFLALIYILNKIMYVPLMDFMAKRDKSIAEDMANISSNDSETHSLEEEANKIISEAKAKANEIKTSIISKAKDELAKVYEDTKESLEKDLDSFISELAGKKEELRTELVSNMQQYKDSLESKLKNI